MLAKGSGKMIAALCSFLTATGTAMIAHPLGGSLKLSL
jgi:hypothetical protein